MKPFKYRLQYAMKYRNMKPADLANASGIGKSSISQWISGKYQAKQDKVYILASALKVSPSWLMGADASMFQSINGNSDKHFSTKETDKIIQLQSENRKLRKQLDAIKKLLK